MKQRSMWLTLIVLITAGLACAIPSIPSGIRTIKGSGNVVTADRDVSGFDSVALLGFGRVIITQGDGESLTVETDDNLMQYIETEVRGGTLELGFTEDDLLLNPSESIIFRLSLIDLAALDSSGAGKFEIDELETDRLEITLSGAGDITIDSLSATDLVVTVNGAGQVELAGQIKTQEITLNGLGNYVAPDLESQTATVRVPGGVEYYGSPHVTQDISGVGSVTSRGDK